MTAGCGQETIFLKINNFYHFSDTSGDVHRELRKTVGVLRQVEGHSI